MSGFKKRITIFKNGQSNGGKVISLPLSMEEFLKTASEKLCIKAAYVFNMHGGEIDEIELIRDDDVVFISSGESFITKVSTACDGWITLNVGGKHFTTSKSNITDKEPASMLARMFAEDNEHYWMKPSLRDSLGAYLIDRSPLYFEPILNYLRNGQIIIDKNVNPRGVLEEAEFYGIASMVPQLEAYIQNEDAKVKDNAPLTRKEVVRSLINTTTNDHLRFQGVNLRGADLYKLDLRYINFKYACLAECNLIGANLSYCCLERADLSQSNLEGAQLLGVKALCANMEGANLKGCTFEDPSGTRTVFEGVNLKGANMEGSNMAGVNLRVATLKNANLKNCDLRAAVLAGADLQNCDLSGSDLQEANLRGANLKDATFEFMLTPLHMSQTVR